MSERRTAVRVVLPILVLLLVVGLGWWLAAREPADVESLLSRARAAARAGRAAVVLETTERILEREPDRLEALELWAEATWNRGDRERAVNRLLEVDPASEGAAALLAKAGSLAIEMGSPVLAERALTRAVQANPEDLAARNRLAYLYGVEGRAWEMQRHLFVIVRRGEVELDHLLMLEAGEPVAQDNRFVERCLRSHPDQSLALLGPARTDVFQNRSESAIPVLRRITGEHPDVAEAWAQLGLALVDTDADALADWEKSLPPESLSHPGVRFVLALHAEHRGDSAAEVEHLFATLRLDPDHRAANVRLATILESLGRSDEARAFAERADRIRQLADAVDDAYQNPSPDGLHRCARLTHELHRPWEARAWCQLALARFPEAAWAAKQGESLRSVLLERPPRTTGPELPDIDLGDRARLANRESIEGAAVATTVRFRDVGRELGVEFAFEAGPGDGSAMRMYQSFGGGVAVLDYDADGDPDLYFTQGGSPEPDRGGRDRLFRNLGDRFEEVSGPAGVVARDYGNVAAVGDLDGDGFDDLVLGNLGRNRILLNNGDGTFDDVTDPGAESREWTTGFGIADFDGDGLADLYELNYLDFGRAPFTRCEPGKESATCGPDPFDAAPDRVWTNVGDGSFRDSTETAHVASKNGKGLGIVVGNLDGRPGLDLFVANDNAPNLLFVNETQTTGSPRFAERGLVGGLAVDRDGFTQACMGVAAGDVDGDGRVDLFVTNFSDQSNTLYRQDSDGLFDDATRRYGLRTPGYAPLGFGTQFLDADLDGRLDLVVANGHVYDRTGQGEEFHMRPQFFHNRGNRFEELDSPDLGEYFANRWLGRGLARLDWNGDGRDEFVVSNIGSPATLVVNDTEPAGPWIAIRIVDTEGERTAIGTSVTISADVDGTPWTRARQLLAGDGYQASNERQLVFGVPRGTSEVEISVEWPDGRRSEFGKVPVEQHHLVRRGDERALALPAIGASRSTGPDAVSTPTE